MSAPADATPTSAMDRSLLGATALLVFALTAVVALQIIGRHVVHQPIPWTEEIARLLLAWLMCVGGVVGLRQGQHPRVTAFIRRLQPAHRAAVDRGLRLVLLGLFASLLMPAMRLTLASASETLPA